MQMVKGILCWWSPRQGGPLAAHGRQKARSVGPPPFPHPKRSRSPSRSTPSTNHPARSTPHHRRGLDGAKTYTLALPANIAVKTFWAIDIYDTQTRSLLQTDNPYPSINNRFADVKTTGDGETIICFGPNEPGADVNWLRTIPGKS